MVGYVFKEKKKSKDKKETPTREFHMQVNDIGCQLNKMEFNSLFTG